MDIPITGKIILKKKSGPGEITGVTEVDISNDDSRSCLFKELQFTEPGDYVINVFSTNELIESFEMNVRVLEGPKIIPQDQNKNIEKKEKNVDGTRPIIAQIDKPTIVVKKIEMDQDVAGPNGQSDFLSGLGYTPLIWYKSYSIEEKYITHLSLFHEGIVPKIRFTFEDTKEIMKGENGPKDNTTIDLFLNSTSKNLKSIHISFKIEEFLQGPPNPSQKYTIKGTINIPDLYIVNNKSYNDTSFGALRQISKELGIGFNSNIDNTDDKMPWKNSYKKPFEFINDIISRSYISDESYMGGYIDYYYCFNYVDIEKEMNRDISTDVGIESSGYSEQQQSGESERITKLILTNDKSQKSSCFFISDFSTRNDSTKKSIKDGSITITKGYDRNNKTFMIFNVDSTTSDGSKTIILKGQDNDSKYFEENIKTNFTGKIDTDNVHKNYNYAVTQNRINLDTLNKIALNIKLPTANFNLYKFQKVNVVIVNDTQTPSQTDKINYRYSGEYIIADITFNWIKGKMSQDIRLVRKELGKTPDEIKNDIPIQAKKENKEINDNPTPEISDKLNTSNSIYVVGQTYLVTDNNDRLYHITIKKLLENGRDVIASIKIVDTSVVDESLTFNVENKNVFTLIDSKSVITDSKIFTIYNNVFTYSNNDENIYYEGDESQFTGNEEQMVVFDYVPDPLIDKQGDVNMSTNLNSEIIIPKDGTMTISKSGLKKLVAHEGSKYTVYDDKTGKSISNYSECLGKPTIGVGHLIQNNEKVFFSKYLKPNKMTETEVFNLLIIDLKVRIEDLNKRLKVKVTQNQFDALLSLMFNTGSGNPFYLKAVSLTNQGKFKEASEVIRSGPKTAKPDGRLVESLSRRRNDEADQYLS